MLLNLAVILISALGIYLCRGWLKGGVLRCVLRDYIYAIKPYVAEERLTWALQKPEKVDPEILIIVDNILKYHEVPLQLFSKIIFCESNTFVVYEVDLLAKSNPTSSEVQLLRTLFIPLDIVKQRYWTFQKLGLWISAILMILEFNM
jgi:hypothetical protein